jgi:ribosome-interacting GTPase 1
MEQELQGNPKSKAAKKALKKIKKKLSNLLKQYIQSVSI